MLKLFSYWKTACLRDITMEISSTLLNSLFWVLADYIKGVSSEQLQSIQSCKSSLAISAGVSLTCHIWNHLQTLLLQLLLVLVLQWLQLSRLQHIQGKRFFCNHATSTAEMRTKSTSQLPVPFLSSLPQGSSSARLQPWKAALGLVGMFVHRSHYFK